MHECVWIRPSRSTVIPHCPQLTLAGHQGGEVYTDCSSFCTNAQPFPTHLKRSVRNTTNQHSRVVNLALLQRNAKPITLPVPFINLLARRGCQGKPPPWLLESDAMQSYGPVGGGNCFFLGKHVEETEPWTEQWCRSKRCGDGTVRTDHVGGSRD